MKFDNDLAAIHGYLCADGYVIKNPKTQKHKYYHIGLRNTNSVLLHDFQKRFTNVFGITPHITADGRCRIQSKEIFEMLTKNQTYYSHRWKLPNLSKDQLRMWLRAYFDCDGWVECQKAKSRTIRLDSVNKSGLEQIRRALGKFGISATITPRKRNMWRLNICGMERIKKFSKHISFLHPDKVRRLADALASYKVYTWKIPESEKDILAFIQTNGRLQKSRNETRFFSIQKSNMIRLKTALYKCGLKSTIYGPWKNNTGSRYYVLVMKNEVNGNKWLHQSSSV